MTRYTSVSPIGSEFGNFLFASIGADKNGMLLTVPSALARTGVDPWEETTKSIALTREAVKAAPSYNPSAQLDRSQEMGIYRHHGRRGYWADEMEREAKTART